MKYHVEIDDAFWTRRFPHWNRMAIKDREAHVMAEMKRLREFLEQETPQGEVHLLVSATGTIRIAEEGPVHVKPIHNTTDHVD